MKRILFLLIICMPLAVMAQGNWEIPTQNMPKAVVKKEKKQKAEKAAQKKTSKIKEEDRPYLAGAVPEVDGKVVYTLDIDVPGKTASEVYDMVYRELERLTKDDNQTEGSRIALVNREEKSIIATYDEWMTFSDKFLVLDRASFCYIIIAKCVDGKASLSIERLIYKYDADRNTTVINAEDFITDRLMLTNNGTRLRKMNSKFRRKTVDRMNKVIDELKRGIR